MVSRHVIDTESQVCLPVDVGVYVCCWRIGYGGRFELAYVLYVDTRTTSEVDSASTVHIEDMKSPMNFGSISFVKSGFWVCPSCIGAVRIKTRRRLPSIALRDIANSSKSSQNVTPTLEQLRAPFKEKNRSTLYVYTLLFGDRALTLISIGTTPSV